MESSLSYRSSVRVLVLDGEQRASLAVTRSLVASGFAVTVAARGAWSLAARSRGAAWVAVPEDPMTAPAKYVARIAEHAAALGARIVLPVTDASVDALLAHRDALPPGVILPLASYSTFRAASDKVLVHELACRVGLGIEESVVVEAQGAPIPQDPALFPGVVKPHRSVVGEGSRTRTSVRLVTDPEGCAAAIRALPASAFPVLVQRRVRGAGVGVFVLRWKGRTLARFAHRRLREMPPAGGVSVLSESVALAPALQEACDRLLDALAWEGPAMIECKEDEERGGWRVIEINGRFWGSLQLAIDAGVDFPRLLIDAALGEPPAPPPQWRVGQRLRWEMGDLDHLLVRLLRSRRRLDLPETAPSRLRAVMGFLRFRPRQERLEILRRGDTGPFLAELRARFLPRT